MCPPLGANGSEDCLFLNIFTPLLPDVGNNTAGPHLKPVMFYIHGGAFATGAGSISVYDGGNLASRGDVVVVTINYRLGPLGFLTLADNSTNGNYGLADQTVALNWVHKLISSFGGDPQRITIFGQSAGASSVKYMLGSPKAVGKFAAAMAFSNIGGIGRYAGYDNLLQSRPQRRRSTNR
jgi:carboxylesterase type B